MNTHYNIEEWAAQTTRGRQVFNYNYSMPGTELKGWKLLKVVPLQESADASAKAYIWLNNINPEHEMIRIDITERHSWRLAQENLYEYLIQCMRTDIPMGTRNLSKLGDVVFVGRELSNDLPGAISFTRGNLFISVRSVGEKNVDVSGIATLLDHLMNDPPVKAELQKGKVRAVSPVAVTVKANEAYVLIRNLQETKQLSRWMKIIVPDGELSRKGNTLLYISAQGGEKKVDTYAISGD